jgi:hypothetical protein
LLSAGELARIPFGRLLQADEVEHAITRACISLLGKRRIFRGNTTLCHAVMCGNSA